MTRPAPATATGHLLVVDDNEMNRDMLSRRLLRQGHTVDLAINGLDALERLGRADYDLVLLDIMMPEMNGFELLERMKADPSLRHVPVILISALDDAESVVKGIEMGADDHLPKPFNPHILRARVESCLAKKRLHDREQLYARSLQREIDIGRDIQRGFLPEALPEAEGWEFGARFEPARSVAGDFYDAFALKEGGHIAFVVADVCDKGVGAALFMALFRTLIRALVQPLSPPAEIDDGLARALGGVNDYIARNHGSANMFATVFLAILDPATGQLVYANCGHEPGIVLGPGGIRARLEPTGPAVGMMASMAFGTARATLAPGESLVLFTDGVTDARASDGTQFGEDRLLELLPAAPPHPARQLEAIVDAVHTFTSDEASFDDITLFAVRRAGPPPSPA